MDKKLKSKLNKVLELTARGVDNERVNAEKLLEIMLKKHNITIEQLKDNAVEKRYYRYKLKREREILVQIFSKVLDQHEVELYSAPSLKHIAIEATLQQHIEINELYKFHKDNMKKEFEKFKVTFFTAYVQRHGLYCETNYHDLKDCIKEEEQSEEDIEKVFKVMDAMDDPLYNKQIKAH